ncbi:MAG: hypothetical protein ACQESF_05145 [Nanobdellota archaeon]
MSDMDPETQKILEKYKDKLAEEIKLDSSGDKANTKSQEEIKEQRKNVSRQYKQFKEEMIPKHFSMYEKACNFSERILKISPDKKNLEAMKEAISSAHLNITPTGVASFAIIGPLVFMLITATFSMGIPYALGKSPSMFFLAFSVLGGIAIMLPLQNFPKLLANVWRLKSSNEMILAVFYTVTYMRHTSNLELALEFSANHLSGPLALDLRKVIWDLETEKYSTLKESLDSYLEGWRKWNMEFIEAMHLIESSLYEGSDERRLSLLDKSLNIMLDETYEKMLHYAHNLKAPMTTLNMLGFVLPILGMVLLPLIVNFMGNVKWYYLFMIYDVALPIGVFYMGRTVLASRPTGYGDTDITQNNPQLREYMNIKANLFGKEKIINPLYVSLFVFFVLFIVGMSPIIMTSIGGMKNIKLGDDPSNELFPEGCKGAEYCLFEFRSQKIDGKEVTAGPFDLFPSVLSILVPLSIGLGIGIFYKIRTSRIIKIRDKSKELEKEFSAALFQLGNRLGDGMPAEIAFGKVGNVMANTTSGGFFNEVSRNITQKGMGVKNALFDKNSGVIFKYPSSIILSSMKVLVEAVKKSPKIASQAIISISSYIKEMHRIDERLKDLLSDVISSMKSQASFLAPVIAGIVIGIGSMITNVLGKIGPALGNQGAAGSAGGAADMTDFFGIGIPTFHFQIIVGIYVIELIYILTVLVNGVENGSDKLKEQYLVGNNMIRGTLLYCTLSMIVVIIFNMIAEVVITKTLSGA